MVHLPQTAVSAMGGVRSWHWHYPPGRKSEIRYIMIVLKLTFVYVLVATRWWIVWRLQFVRRLALRIHGNVFCVTSPEMHRQKDLDGLYRRFFWCHLVEETASRIFRSSGPWFTTFGILAYHLLVLFGLTVTDSKTTSQSRSLHKIFLYCVCVRLILIVMPYVSVSVCWLTWQINFT